MDEQDILAAIEDLLVSNPDWFKVQFGRASLLYHEHLRYAPGSETWKGLSPEQQAVYAALHLVALHYSRREGVREVELPDGLKPAYRPRSVLSRELWDSLKVQQSMVLLGRQRRGIDSPIWGKLLNVARRAIEAASTPAHVIEPKPGPTKARERESTRPSIGGTNTDWQNVQGRLLAKRERGEPYTTNRKLAAELECSDATIRKAIRKSDELKGWKARTARPKTAPKATGLGAVVRDNRWQTTEAAPDDVLPTDDVDATMARLIDQAEPDERAKLNALDSDERRALVAAIRAQNLDDEPSPVEADKPGDRPRKVRQHKRA